MNHPHAHTPEEHEKPDAWHAHTVDDHPQQAHGESLDGLRVFLIGLVGYLLTVACIVVVTIYFVAYKNNDQIQFEEYPERSMGASAALQGPALDQREKVLTGLSTNQPAAWTDPEAGKVTIPLNLAIDKVVEKYAKRPAAK